MTSDDMEHVSYLGALVFGRLIYRGDLFRDASGRYWAEASLTRPTGAWEQTLHRLDADEQGMAESEALRSVLEYLSRRGVSVREIEVIHLPPQLPPPLMVGEPPSYCLH